MKEQSKPEANWSSATPVLLTISNPRADPVHLEEVVRKLDLNRYHLNAGLQYLMWLVSDMEVDIPYLSKFDNDHLSP